ncbi:MAG TPA: tail fiber domain-containing protein [Candidatus Competibacteraceae bacterium]|nr:tail fiber domain-containing protein [Candidatus Competibacteraceae bacterium]
MSQQYAVNEQNESVAKKWEYQRPKLVHYGKVRDLTRNGTTSGNEGSNYGQCKMSNNRSCTSERRVKENVVRIGTHPLGIGLYVFDYKPEYRKQWGHGRQFGVMVDEVEPVMPEAVSVHPDGYKMVDYAMLGISRNLH